MKSQQGTPIFKKTQGLITQHIGPETLLYSETTHQAFCLNPMAAQVWRELDGVRTPREIAAAATNSTSMPISEDLVLFTIGELRRDGLLEEEQSPASVLVTPSRRDLMRQLGASAMIMLPVVAAVTAPKAAQAYTGCLDCGVSGVTDSPLLRPGMARQRATASKSTQLQPVAPLQPASPTYGDVTLTK